MSALSGCMRIVLIFAFTVMAGMPGMAQNAPAHGTVEELGPLAEKIANVEIMLENHFNTLRGSLYTPARGFSPVDPANNWQYQVYRFDGRKYAVGWMMFQTAGAKSFVTNFLLFKEKEPGKLSFIGGETGMDGKLDKLMFAKLVRAIGDPVVILTGSQFVYVGMLESSPSLMNYDPGDSKLAGVELLTDRIIVGLRDSSGAASEKFFDWNDKAKRFTMNFTGKR